MLTCKPLYNFYMYQYKNRHDVRKSITQLMPHPKVMIPYDPLYTISVLKHALLGSFNRGMLNTMAENPSIIEQTVDLCLLTQKDQIELIDQLKNRPEKLGWHIYLSIDRNNVKLWQLNRIGDDPKPKAFVHGNITFDNLVKKAYFLDSKFFVVETLKKEEEKVMEYDFKVYKTFLFDPIETEADINEYVKTIEPYYTIKYIRKDSKDYPTEQNIESDKVIRIECEELETSDFTHQYLNSVLFLINKKSGSMNLFYLNKPGETTYINSNKKGIKDIIILSYSHQAILITEEGQVIAYPIASPNLDGQVQELKLDEEKIIISEENAPLKNYCITAYKDRAGIEGEYFIGQPLKQKELIIYDLIAGTSTAIKRESGINLWTVHKDFLFMLTEEDEFEVINLETYIREFHYPKLGILDIKGYHRCHPIMKADHTSLLIILHQPDNQVTVYYYLWPYLGEKDLFGKNEIGHSWKLELYYNPKLGFNPEDFIVRFVNKKLMIRYQENTWLMDLIYSKSNNIKYTNAVRMADVTKYFEYSFYNKYEVPTQTKFAKYQYENFAETNRTKFEELKENLLGNKKTKEDNQEQEKSSSYKEEIDDDVEIDNQEKKSQRQLRKEIFKDPMSAVDPFADYKTKLEMKSVKEKVKELSDIKHEKKRDMQKKKNLEKFNM